MMVPSRSLAIRKNFRINYLGLLSIPPVLEGERLGAEMEGVFLDGLLMEGEVPLDGAEGELMVGLEGLSKEGFDHELPLL